MYVLAALAKLEPERLSLCLPMLDEVAKPCVLLGTAGPQSCELHPFGSAAVGGGGGGGTFVPAGGGGPAWTAGRFLDVVAVPVGRFHAAAAASSAAASSVSPSSPMPLMVSVLAPAAAARPASRCPVPVPIARKFWVRTA